MTVSNYKVEESSKRTLAPNSEVNMTSEWKKFKVCFAGRDPISITPTLVGYIDPITAMKKVDRL